MLSLKNVSVEFDLGDQKLLALKEVSLNLKQGEILGLVGESGCGKSTLGKSIVSLVKPKSGEILFESINLLALAEKDFRPWRKKIQMIFQDPWSSLNPRISIGNQILEVVKLHHAFDNERPEEKVFSLLDEVGLNKDQFHKFPHEFSGGQLQRIGIARALAVDPTLIICDEVVSALDVSVQAQILNLLLDLKAKRDLSLLFISHDLGVIRNICDRVAVLYMGKLVELNTTDEIFSKPQNPYTCKLLNSIAGFNLPEAFNEKGIERYNPSMWQSVKSNWNLKEGSEDSSGYLSLL